MPAVSPLLRTVGVSFLAAGSAFALSGCGLLLSALDGGNVMELNVGDCFNETDLNTALAGGEVSELPLVDCAEEHDSEFFFSHEMTGDEFPGIGVIETEVDEVCSGENFTAFAGVPAEESELYVGALYPTEQTWDMMDDREILCYVNTAGEAVTDTLEGASR